MHVGKPGPATGATICRDFLPKLWRSPVPPPASLPPAGLRNRAAEVQSGVGPLTATLARSGNSRKKSAAGTGRGAGAGPHPVLCSSSAAQSASLPERVVPSEDNQSRHASEGLAA